MSNTLPGIALRAMSRTAWRSFQSFHGERLMAPGLTYVRQQPARRFPLLPRPRAGVVHQLPITVSSLRNILPNVVDVNADPDATCPPAPAGHEARQSHRQFDGLRDASRLEDKLIKASSRKTPCICGALISRLLNV